MSSRSNKGVHKNKPTLGFFALRKFREKLKKRQLQILSESNERLIKNEKIDAEQLASLNSVLDNVQSRIFSYVFWRILIIVLLSGILLNLIHVNESNIDLECNLNSLRFYTSKEIHLSDRYDNKITTPNFLKLQNKWSIIHELFPTQYEDLLIQNIANNSSIELNDFTIPAGSYVTIFYNQAGELEIKSELTDTTLQTELSLSCDSALLFTNLSTPLDSISHLDAKSLSGYKYSKIIISDPELSMKRVSMDSVFFLQYKTTEDFVQKQYSSILQGQLKFTEFTDRHYSLNQDDTLAVDFARPIYAQLEIENNTIRFHAQGQASKILAGAPLNKGAESLDLSPSYFNYLDSTVSSEWKNLFLTLVLSIVTFLFIRQRKDI
jgi:hypothetical protein